MRLTPIPEEQTKERWREHSQKYASTAPEPAPTRNVREVLDLGTTVFLSFRGRAYGVPPLPWREAQRLLAAWNEVLRLPALIDDEHRSQYARAMEEINDTLWANTRPLGTVRRALKRIGLLRNPFEDASDAELGELLDFFLASRTKHTGSVRALDRHLLPI